MENDEFEEKLNSAVKSSPYVIKREPSAILASYHEQENAKKNFHVRKGLFIGVCSALAAAVVALAVYVPLSLKSAYSSDDPAAASVDDVVTSPLANEQQVLGYEAKALSSYFVSQKSLAKRSDDSPSFSEAVGVYEKMESSVRSAYEWKDSDILAETGSFTGNDGISYPYKLTINDTGVLLYNLDFDKIGQVTTSSFEGEMTLPDGTSKKASGSTEKRGNGKTDLELRIYKDETSYMKITEISTNGKFYFSFGLYLNGSLSYGYNVRLAKASNRQVIMASYWNGNEDVEGSFRVYRQSETSYRLYQTFVTSYINLQYSGTTRSYAYNGMTINK
jgi:hypothetical protein